MEFVLAQNRERFPLLVGQISAHQAKLRQVQSAWDLSAAPPMVSVRQATPNMISQSCTVFDIAHRSLQARILPHLSIRRLFERQPKAEDVSEGGDSLRTGSRSTAGRLRGRREEESSRQRLPRSLAPWHTLPFMTREVGLPGKRSERRSYPGARAGAITADVHCVVISAPFRPYGQASTATPLMGR